MTMETLPYKEQAQVFFRQANEELDRGDLLQAAEKGWGAAAQMIKAVAQQRGWPHYEHGLLREVIGRLVEESQDEELMTCFDAASELHRIFYEGHVGHFGVSLRLRQVERLLAKLGSQ